MSQLQFHTQRFRRFCFDPDTYGQSVMKENAGLSDTKEVMAMDITNQPGEFVNIAK